MAHSAVRYLLRVIEAVLLVLLLAGAVFAWRLSQGPIKIDSVGTYVAEALSDLDPALHFRIDHTEFRWVAFKGHPQITARDIRVLDASGGVIAGLPSMVVGLSASALLRGIIAPEEIVLSSPIIRFVHRRDGTLGLGLQSLQPAANTEPQVPGNEPAAVSGDAVAQSLVRALTQAPTADSRAEYLATITIDDSTLVLLDEATGKRWIAPDANLSFMRDKGDIRFHGALPVIEEGRRWNLTAEGRFIGAKDMLTLDVNVDGFRPARIAGLAPQLQPLSMIDLRLSGTLGATFTLAQGTAHIDGVKFEVKGQEGQLKLPAPIDRNYPIKSLALKGTVGKDIDQVAIEHFRIDVDRKGETPSITMSAEATSLNSAPVVVLDASLAQLSLLGLKDFWPATVKHNTRQWITENLTGAGAGLSDTRLKLHLAGPTFADLDADQMALTAKLHNITVEYMDGMPKVEGTDGAMTVTTKDVTIDVNGGHVPDAITNKGLRVPNGRVHLYGLGGKSERADIKLHIAGDFGDAMRLIDHQPLGYVKAMGLDAKRASGGADINLALEFPLVKELKRDQVKIHVDAKVNDIGMPDVAFGLPLSAGNFALSLDGAGMDVNGTGAVGGIRAAVVWRENFEGGIFRSRYVLDPILDNKQRPLVGLDLLPFNPPYIDGPVKAHVIYTVKRDSTSDLDADLDLAAAAVAIPELGWHKKPGEHVGGKVNVIFRDGKLDTVPSFHVTGDGLDLSGTVTFAPDQNIRLLTISDSLAGETQLRGTVARSDEGAYDIDMKGTAFNAGAFFKEMGRDDGRPKVATADGAPPPLIPFKVRAAFERAWMTPGADFKDVNVFYERDRDGVRAIDFSSMVDDTVPFTLTLKTENGKRTFTGVSNAGGSVVRTVGLFSDIVGGNFTVNGEVAPGGTVKGTAEIKTFKLIKAPVLARLLSVAALTGILDELNGGGISFKTLRVPFSYSDSVLHISDGEMYGNALGLTGKGTYNFATSTMDFNGTLIPAYAINSVLNRIPLLGTIFNGGDKGGGIFAATYTYRGDVATAQPSVNPLAALTPGFLRHVFDIFKSSAPPKPPPPVEEQTATPPVSEPKPD